jgi:hypothetical protein
MWNRFFFGGGGGGGHENFYLLNVCCLGGSPKNLLGVEGGLPKKFFLICKILIAPHHINYECSLKLPDYRIDWFFPYHLRRVTFYMHAYWQLIFCELLINCSFIIVVTMTNNIVNNCNFDAADPTERHVSDVGILNKYNYYLFIYLFIIHQGTRLPKPMPNTNNYKC